jgi:hypothetical protein
MKLNEKTMKRILKEEYSKRINYFLNEKITIIDKRGVNVLQYAKGLKVLDQAGNQYTFDTIIKKGREEFAKLYLPDEPREDAFGELSFQPLQEDDRDEVGFYSRMKNGVKDIQPVKGNNEYLFDDDTNYDMQYNDLSSDDIEDEPDRMPKLPDRKYILVPMGEFEERFRLKTEEE